MATSYYFWGHQRVGLLRGREKMVYWCMPLFLLCFLSSFYHFLSLRSFFTLSFLLFSCRGLFPIWPSWQAFGPWFSLGFPPYGTLGMDSKNGHQHSAPWAYGLVLRFICKNLCNFLSWVISQLTCECFSSFLRGPIVSIFTFLRQVILFLSTNSWPFKGSQKVVHDSSGFVVVTPKRVCYKLCLFWACCMLSKFQ